MDEITYRLATTEDVRTLVALREAFLEEVSDAAELAAAAPQLHDSLQRFFETSLPTGEFVAYLAVAKGRVVACSGLVFYRHPPSTKSVTGFDGYIMNMYTLPEWRGRGIATEILRRLVAHAQERGCQWALLHSMTKAEPLYERAGFVEAHGGMRLDLR